MSDKDKFVVDAYSTKEELKEQFKKLNETLEKAGSNYLDDSLEAEARRAFIRQLTPEQRDDLGLQQIQVLNTDPNRTLNFDGLPEEVHEKIKSAAEQIKAQKSSKNNEKPIVVTSLGPQPKHAPPPPPGQKKDSGIGGLQ